MGSQLTGQGFHLRLGPLQPGTAATVWMNCSL